MTRVISVIVKSIHPSVPDQTIQIDSSQTVFSLKERIHLEHPDKPKVADQRLIYFGQILEDTLTLASVLRHPAERSLHAVHLAYPMSQSQNTMNSEGIRQRNTGTSDASSQPGLHQNSNSPQLTSPHALTDPIQQMAAWQQMYTQYMTSYMQYIQSANMPVLPNSQVPLNASDVQPTPVVEEPANDVPDQVNNAAGRAVARQEPEEEGGRVDWLDYVYWFIQVGIFGVIIHFHSTMTRILVVVLTCLIVYLYQSGFFTMAPQQQRPTEAREQDRPENAPTDNVSEPPPTDNINIQPQQEERSIFALSMTFLTTFFTSLIPENNPPIAM